MQEQGAVRAAIRPDERERPAASRHRRAAGRWRRRAALALLGVLALAFISSAVIVNVEHLKLEPVLSGSMRPGIQPGDLAVIRPVPADHLRVGDVIAYVPPGQTTPVLHRIASVTAAGIVTKGDANRVPDPWGRVRPQSANVERLVAVVPKVGWLIDAKRTLLFAAGGVLILALAAAGGRALSDRRGQRQGDTQDSPGAPASAERQLLTEPEKEVDK